MIRWAAGVISMSSLPVAPLSRFLSLGVMLFVSIIELLELESASEVASLDKSESRVGVPVTPPRSSSSFCRLSKQIALLHDDSLQFLPAPGLSKFPVRHLGGHANKELSLPNDKSRTLRCTENLSPSIARLLVLLLLLSRLQLRKCVIESAILSLPDGSGKRSNQALSKQSLAESLFIGSKWSSLKTMALSSAATCGRTSPDASFPSKVLKLETACKRAWW
mmetsp:Transcript_36320/g.81834  ORF Transcript_36320/g.81834 Transcript_36320/m.81834 type:complete len:221 (+) Transcript_36320:211-873(+)